MGCSTRSISRAIRRWETSSFRHHLPHSKWGFRRCLLSNKICPFTSCRSSLPTSVRGLCECLPMHDTPRLFPVRIPACVPQRRACDALRRAGFRGMGAWVVNFSAGMFRGVQVRVHPDTRRGWVPSIIRVAMSWNGGSRSAGKMCPCAIGRSGGCPLSKTGRGAELILITRLPASPLCRWVGDMDEWMNEPWLHGTFSMGGHTVRKLIHM